jgi:CheY-like chemotaxis protein
MTKASRVIVCEDEKDNADTISTLLRLCGFEVFSCQEAVACLKKANEWSPDAAIIDVGLPVISGYDLARELRTLPGGEDLLLIALTGYGLRQDVARARIAGFDWHMRKPAPPSAIIDLLAGGDIDVPEATRL